MHNPELIVENQTHRFPQNFEIQIVYLISARRQDQVIVNKNKTKKKQNKTKKKTKTKNKTKTKTKQNKKQNKTKKIKPKEKITSRIVDFVVPVGHRVKL